MDNIGLPQIDILGYDPDSLVEFFDKEFGRGAYHAIALFRHVYHSGNTELSQVPEFRPAPKLAGEVSSTLPLRLPEIVDDQIDEGTRKFTVGLADRNRVESVIIRMRDWETLCISSQVGCARACAFCETARMGLIRNLKTSEIVSQWAVARFVLGSSPRNLVFMGMGEPFDNFDALIQTVDILSDSRGAAIPKRRMSISTSGNVNGIRRLTEMDARFPDRAYRTLRLALSLNASNDETRSFLMPINRTWPLSELKSALLDTPQSRMKDGLFYEYVLIPGVNDRDEDAFALLSWMDGLGGKINLIPYHPRRDSPWRAPDTASLDHFRQLLYHGGRECRIRTSRGSDIAAACGMLANRTG